MRWAFVLVLASSLASAAPDLSKAPPIPARAKWSPPLEQAVTRAGTQVAILPRSGLPIVHVLVTVPAGSALEPAGKSGLAQAVARMLDEGGAGKLGPAALREAFDDLGSELEIDADQAGVRIGLTVLAPRLPRAISLIGDLLARPRFEAAAFPAARERLVAEILKERAEPRRVAENVFLRAVYGDHPYGRPPLGRRADVERLSLDDVRGFWAEHYGPKTVSVLLVGDVIGEPRFAVRGASGEAVASRMPAMIEAVRAQVEAALAGWSSRAQPPPLPPDPPPPVARVVIVDRPGAPQSALHLGHVGVSYASPDLPAARVIDTVLGGAFTSRLNQNLREKRGYTYGVRARFEPKRGPGPFAVRCAVRSDVTAESVRELYAELSLRAPLTADEVKKAQALHGQQLVEAYASGQTASAFFSELALGGQPFDSGAQLDAAVQALGPGPVAQAVPRLVRADALTLVVVGDRKSIEPKLRALPGLGPIEYRDVDGEALK